MTQPPALTLNLSLEARAQAIGRRFSRTQQEREAIAVLVDELVEQYELQGGRFALTWVERHAGMSHGTALTMLNAGYALRRKHLPPGQGIGYASTIGRLLKRGHTLQEAQKVASTQQGRQQAAQEAGIGVGKLKYPKDSTPEFANAYTQLAASLTDAGLEVPDMPEMTVMMTRLAVSNMTPGQLRNLELGEAIGTQPQNVRTDFYSWLAAQHCCHCGMPAEQLHHIFVGDLQGAPGGRRHHNDKGQELLLPCCARCHARAHTMKQAEMDRAWFGIEAGSIIRAARYLSQWAEERGVLRGNK